MKKTFLGIIFIIISVIVFLIGGLFWYVSNHTLDGPAGLYGQQHMIMRWQQFFSELFCSLLGLVS